MTTELRERANACLGETDPQRKCAAASAMLAAVQDGEAPIDATRDAVVATAGRPERPRVVPPRALPARGLGTDAGRAAFLHAVAHIEFNAINLACDAVVRFSGMPIAFYRDWARVAADEARHFSLLAERLAQLGYRYGDFDAHDGLWRMAEATTESCLERMALVPRVLEARGLDVTPALIGKLEHAGDAASVAILRIILDEEVTHVAIGTAWFHWCCAQIGAVPEERFAALLRGRGRAALRGPYNRPARLAAGFSESELQLLSELERAT